MSGVDDLHPDSLRWRGETDLKGSTRPGREPTQEGDGRPLPHPGRLAPTINHSDPNLRSRL